MKCKDCGETISPHHCCLCAIRTKEQAEAEINRYLSQLANYAPDEIGPTNKLIKILREKEDAEAKLAARQKATCVWTYDEHCDMYDASCGEACSFIEGTAEENNVKFCHACGGEVTFIYPALDAGDV